MKNVKLIMLAYVLIVPVIYGAAYNVEASSKMCKLFKEIIKKRSLDDFTQQLSNVEQLHYYHRRRLRGICKVYVHALDTIREMRAHPNIQVELEKMIEKHDNINGTPLGDVMQTIAPEFKLLSDDALYKKVERDKNVLSTITTALK